jgi:hypothetical protein
MKNQNILGMVAAISLLIAAVVAASTMTFQYVHAIKARTTA